MRLLYIADNGFAFHEGSYYYTRPNAVNCEQYLKYFDDICFIARNSNYSDSMLPIDTRRKASLVGRYDVKEVKRAMVSLRNDYDAVLVRNGLLGCYAAKYAKQLGKILISYCGADPFEFQKSQATLKGVLIAYYWRWLEKKKMMMGDYAHYCTKVLYDRYPCKGPYLVCSNVSIKPDNAVLVRRIEKINHTKGVLTIGLSGQFKESDRKGIRTVIEALNILGTDYRFEVVGEGNPNRYSDTINRYCLKDNVSFLGYISDKNQLNEWLDGLDIYVQPSLSEGLPRATIEAMSRGCPVIATNVCGMIDILEEEYLIKPKDYKALADKVRWLSKPAEMLRAAKTNYSKASEYAEDIRDKKLDDFFFSITNK